MNHDPIAIVGMSCRFAPDLDSPEKLWAYLVEGRNGTSEMPDKRWEPYAASSPQATAILRRTTRRASFLDDIEGFDADFFGISPREADFLDPQQRIMLELAWEALAHAGIPPLALRGTDAGVYVAANSNDYGRRLLEDIAHTGAWAVNGTTYYGIANRISYFLDLRGPSMAVDTACAGSLTALHVACQSLREQETPVAIVGGINVMATPALFVALDAAGATSPDGRSKAFDKLADGYGRGEGAGVVVLKRLQDAQRDGDTVLAVLRGSGVFQDGRSDGMMAPNGVAQEHMLRRIYEQAGVPPRTVDYVEAHGTGTPVGDREEAQALAAVFGEGRDPADPCLIGSVKPNIGHVEAGSGIAGIIKTVLALQNGEIPPSLHSEPNPDFAWNDSGLRLVGERTPWLANGHPRRAGVSSYGVGGSIAHVIVQEAPVAEPVTIAERQGAAVYPISAMSEAGMRAVAGLTADWLQDHPDTPMVSVGHTLTQRRSHLSARGAVVAHSPGHLNEQLRFLAEGASSPTIASGRTNPGDASGVVWVFSGHGAQWQGMGRQLLRDEPAFASTLDSLAEVYREEMGWTPREALEAASAWTSYEVQALTYAMQVGLAAVWREHGLNPAAIIGHSVGEIAAAVAAGSLDLEPAGRFACRRAKALRRLEGKGGMALAGLSFDDCQQRLAGQSGAKSVVSAAIAASPQSTVISGDRDAVEALAVSLRAEGIGTWTVDTDIAFHSVHVEEVVDEVATAAAELAPRPAQVPLYSTAMLDPRSDSLRDSAYWATNLREPVRFAGAVEAALHDGYRLFVEISSHPVVTHSMRETFAHLNLDDAFATHSLRRDTDEVDCLLGSLALLYCNGASIDWSRAFGAGELVNLPTVAWQHRPYWIFPETRADATSGGGHDPDRHTLLGGRLTVSGAPPRQVWQTYLDMSSRPYPQDHKVVDVEITPAAVLINTFVSAAEHEGRLPGLSDIVLRSPLAVEPPRIVQTVLSDNTVRLSTRVAREAGETADDENEWLTHSTAIIDWGLPVPGGTVDPVAIRDRSPEEWDWNRVDEMFRRMGVGGYAFKWDVNELRRNEREQLALLTIEPDAAEASSWAHVIDGALTISAVLVTPEYARHQWMSSHIDSIVFHGTPPAEIIVHSVRNDRSPDDTVDVLIADARGQIVGQVRGLRFSPISDEYGAVAAPRDLVHELVWRAVEVDDAKAAELSRIVVVGKGRITDLIAGEFALGGVVCDQIDSPDELDEALGEPADGILVAPQRELAGETVQDAAERCAWTLVQTAQHLIKWQETRAAAGDEVLIPRLWTLTHGARLTADEAALAHAPMWGVSRIIAGEHPDLWGGVIDINAPLPGTGTRLLQVMQTLAGQEDVISLDGEGVCVARLARIERPSDGKVLQCRSTDTYLITGGLGALGLLVARWLADKGARRILLASRRGLPPRTEWDSVRDQRTRRQIEGVLELEALGVTVRTVALDITDAEQVAEALDPAVHGLPPVRGIIHAAGVVRDAMLDKVDLQGLRDVLSSKVDGAMVLHRMFPPGSLDFFVFFSSCGQFARLTGQTSYAAGNSFLDALAAHRFATGNTETTSYGWTSWRGVGMSETISTTMMEANARGLDAVSTNEAFRAWAFGDRFHSPYHAVLRVLPTPPNMPRLPMFRELTATDTQAAEGADQGFSVDWANTPEAELRELVVADVRQQVAAELNLDVADVEVRRPLVELGIDSVMTVALRVRLQRRFGLELPPNILWSKPTVNALAGHLVETLRPAPEEAEAVLG